MKDKEVDGHKLYVRPALRKEERKSELMHETFKYKNSKKRCNLYVKGFPNTTTEEDVRALFSKYGEIESLKLVPAKDQHSPFAFVCYKTPDQASIAKNHLTQQ
jgi:polyadenylate-binding protein